VSETDDDGGLSSHPSSRLDGANSINSPEIDFRAGGRGFGHNVHAADELMNRFSNANDETR
jgi:hypothetical protein